MIKVILWDADGVIINKPRSFSSILAENQSIPMDTILPFFKGPMNDCLIGKADLKEVILPYLKQWNWSKSVDDFLEFWFSSENFIDQRVVAKIAEMRTQGIKCYLATNQEKYRTQYMQTEMKLGQYVEKVFSSAYLGVKKPTHDFFAAVLQELQLTIPHLKKSEVLLIDDDPDNIEGAKSFGMQTLHYTSYEDFLQSLDTSIFKQNETQGTEQRAES